MDLRRPTQDEERLLLALARSAGLVDPEGWLASIQVREMGDGGMGSLELVQHQDARQPEAVIPKATVQFADADGVDVIATLYTGASGAPLELDVWKTDFSPLKRIPTAFRRIEA